MVQHKAKSGRKIMHGFQDLLCKYHWKGFFLSIYSYKILSLPDLQILEGYIVFSGQNNCSLVVYICF